MTYNVFIKHIKIIKKLKLAIIIVISKCQKMLIYNNEKIADNSLTNYTFIWLI